VGQLLCSFSGVRVRRVVDRSHGETPEHAHDCPLLSLYVLGGYRNRTELGERDIAGPSAVLYRAGAAHRNRAGPSGFEQIEIEFDPAWLGAAAVPDTPVSRWSGGDDATGALRRLCLQRPSEAALQRALQQFISQAGRSDERRPPAWLGLVDRRLREDPGLTIHELAAEAERHPAWLGAAYARAAGEGIRAAATRLRIERAARLLRETDAAPAAIALQAGFCDQSHMIRAFRRTLGRTPTEIRADRAWLRQGA